MFDDGDGPVFDDLSAAEWDLVTLANTDLDIEPLYAHDPDVHPPLDTEAGRWARGEVELELVAAVEQQIAFLHAVQMRALARFAALRPGRRGQDYSDFVADEIGLAAHWATAYAGSRLALAFTLTERLPGTLAALARGDIDLRRAQRLAEITAAASPSVARAVEDAVLPDAVEQNSAELSRAARKTLLQLDPDGAAERHRERKKDRRVELNPLDDAMAELRAYLTAPEADQIYHTINNYAQTCRAPFDPRTADQRRADAFCDLLLDPRYPATATGTDGTAGTGTGTGDMNSSSGAAATTGNTDHADSTANQTATPDTSASGATRTSSTSTNNAGTTTGSADVTDTAEADRTYTGARDTGSDSATGAGTAGTTNTGNVTSTGNAPTPASRAGTHSDSVPGGTSSTGSESAPAAGDADSSSGTDTATTGRNDADSTASQTDTGIGTIRIRGTNGSGSTHAATAGSQITPRTGNQTTPATSAGSQTAAPAGTSTGRAGGNRVVGRPSAQVHVTVPLTTLLGLDNQPADLAGYGPIPADLARELAADGVWRRLVTDPLSGSLLDYGRTTYYRPPGALADFVRARDRRCVFPGCGRKATCCDLDHTVCYPDGPTSACNLACLCRHHHRLKHETEWTLHRDGDQFIWTAPTGLRYIRKPEPLTPPVPPPTPLPPPDDEPPPF